jgi:hypothetical protein
MKNSGHKPVKKGADFLTVVARSIGSTLGAVAGKVSASSRSSSLRRTRKHVSTSPKSGKTPFRSTRNGLKRKGRKKSLK